MMNIVMTNFAAYRHFDNPDFSGTKILSLLPTKDTVLRFTSEVNALAKGEELVEGYQPYCKHLFVVNFTGSRAGVVEITDKNRHLLQSEYSERREEELPVLSRYFNAADVDVPDGKFLDVILYSAEQLAKEGMPIEGDWGIVSIHAVHAKAEEPMPPITMMRNALGMEQGGSGAPLDPDKYRKSVEFWSTHATVKGGEARNIQPSTIYTVGTTTNDGPLYIDSYDNKEAAEQHVAHLQERWDAPGYNPNRGLTPQVWAWTPSSLKSEFKGGE